MEIELQNLKSRCRHSPSKSKISRPSLRNSRSSSNDDSHNGAAMNYSSDLIGQIACLPGGVRVRVESIEGDPPTAIARRIDGPMAGLVAICLVSKLEPADSQTEPNTNSEKTE